MHKEVGKFNDIHESAKIGDGTRIAGWVYVGKDVEIGKNCVIGNFCEINPGTKIGDNTLINGLCLFNSNTIIGSHCIMGANVMTADEKYMTPDASKITKKPCVIGNHCKIGQGARLISCEIGDWCSIGAGAVVLEPKIPEKEVWIGMPAKKLRNLKPFELEL